jgi:hypothetical protein
MSNDRNRGRGRARERWGNDCESTEKRVGENLIFFLSDLEESFSFPNRPRARARARPRNPSDRRGKPKNQRSITGGPYHALMAGAACLDDVSIVTRTIGFRGMRRRRYRGSA